MSIKIKVRNIVFVLCIFLIIFGVIIRLHVKSRPLLLDESSYSYTALKMLHENYDYLDILDNKPIGIIGEIHPKILRNWKIKMPVALFEINLEEIFKKLI